MADEGKRECIEKNRRRRYACNATTLHMPRKINKMVQTIVEIRELNDDCLTIYNYSCQVTVGKIGSW